MTTNIIRSYSDLVSMDDYIDRYRYLKLNSVVGRDTFGVDRWINQRFYKSDEWLRIRDIVIVRDKGYDLGIEGYEINDEIIVHHMNPITKDDIVYRTKYLLDPEYMICVSKQTHKAIHYGSESSLFMTTPFLITRSKNDTCPWRN